MNRKNRTRDGILSLHAEGLTEVLFEARYRGLSDDCRWMVFSELEKEGKMVCKGHFNLPKHKLSRVPKQHPCKVKLIASPSFYLSKGTRRGTLVPIEGESKIKLEEFS